MSDPITSAGTPAERPALQAGTAPYVVVDFTVQDGALLLSVANTGGSGAHSVRVAFEPQFRGQGGSLQMSELALFNRLAFLAPAKEIRVFVDTVRQYFGRGEPEVIKVTVTHTDDTGRKYRHRVTHDLGIYRDLPSPGERRGLT